MKCLETVEMIRANQRALPIRNISAKCDRVPEKATKRRSDIGMKAQTYAQVVLRRGGAAKHNLPTANSDTLAMSALYGQIACCTPCHRTSVK